MADTPFDTVDGAQPAGKWVGKWLYGGADDLFADLTWSRRPDMTGSEAPQKLQDAWVATILAVRDVLGTLRNGSCFLINLAAVPLVERALGEPATPCAGYASFTGRSRMFVCGLRWRPDKWGNWIDASASAHMSDEEDVHTWIETATHVVDFSTGDAMGDPDDSWPPMIYWPKCRMPKHPREARGAGSVLLWRKAKALETVQSSVGDIAELITCRAFEILDADMRARLDG